MRVSEKLRNFVSTHLERKTIKIASLFVYITFNNESLGSRNDEERSKVR